MAKRIALITGGMGGLGETISTKMADAGYQVVVTYSPSNKTSAEWLSQMKSKGYTFHAYPCDVGDFESSKACVAKIVAEVGQVDILVNNAGITKDMTFRKMDKAAWDAVIRTNLDSVFNLTKQVYDGMMDRGWGRIINVSSVNGSKGAFGQTNYAAAKAGIAGLTQTLSLELHKLGVTVNCVGPAAATRITGTMPGAPAVIEADDVPDDEWNRMDPAVSSPLVAWLASDEAQHVTGQVIRAVAENIIWMKGWADGPTLNNGGKRWDATKLGTQLATDVFGTRAPGLRY